jgi:hypothetical protein
MWVPPLDPALRSRVEDTVIRMFVATDERNWPLVQSCFTDPFTLDMSSVAGGAPALTSARQATQTWAEAFRTLDHVHHQVGNFQTRVEGTRARRALLRDCLPLSRCDRRRGQVTHLRRHV